MTREPGDEDAFGDLLLGCQLHESKERHQYCSVSLTMEAPQQPHVDSVA